MVSLPELSTFFQTIESYRYSITVGLLLLYFAPYLFPVGWTTVGATWQFVAGLMFFLSVGMIITQDLWPWIKVKTGYAISRELKKEIAEITLRLCKETGDDPPFSIKISDIGDIDNGDIRTFIDSQFANEECKLEDDEVLISKKGLKALKKHI